MSYGENEGQRHDPKYDAQQNDPNCPPETKTVETTRTVRTEREIQQGEIVRAEDHVKPVQRWLQVEDDGMWGDKTTEAFRDRIAMIQRQQGLEETGKLDAATLESIRQEEGDELVEHLQQLRELGITQYELSYTEEEIIEKIEVEIPGDCGPEETGGLNLEEGSLLPPSAEKPPLSERDRYAEPQVPPHDLRDEGMFFEDYTIPAEPLKVPEIPEVNEGYSFEGGTPPEGGVESNLPGNTGEFTIEEQTQPGYVGGDAPSIETFNINGATYAGDPSMLERLRNVGYNILDTLFEPNSPAQQQAISLDKPQLSTLTV